MITFAYKARDASGRIVSGIQDALNEDNAATSLMSRGLMLLSLQKKAVAKSRKRIWKWNSGQNHWDYVGASGSTVQTTIERLDQVAGENREPNFFEILKAVILNGSLGLGSNADSFITKDSK